jgi:hypothetical protein
VTDALFALPQDAIELTSDECYTPPWVFDAMGLTFDLDVAAPPGGPWHVPARRYFTATDDGLAQPWDGLVWCNPPYSTAADWVARWAAHDRGALMTQVASRQPWRSALYSAADAVYIGQVEFARPDGTTLKFGWTPICVAFRGVGTQPARRLAAADKFGAWLLGPATPSTHKAPEAARVPD